MRFLITGATGFVGKVLVEEILRKRRDPSDHIYILIRPKKEPVDDRFRKLLASKCFDNLGVAEKSRIHYIEGDILEKNYGIEEDMLKQLDSRIDCMINVAASINFNESLKTSLRNNYGSTVNTLNLIRDHIPNLKRFIHISTAYVNPPNNEDPVPPERVRMNLDYKEVVGLIEQGFSLDEVNTSNGTIYPNSYCLTKALAEEYVIDNGHSIKAEISILRPSIISNSYRYPSPGWTDSFAAYNGFLIAIGTGLLSNVRVRNDAVFNIVPVDFVTDDILHLVNTHSDGIDIHHSTVVLGDSMLLDMMPSICEVFEHFDFSPTYYTFENEYDYNYIFTLRSYWCDYIPLKLASSYYYLIGNKIKSKKYDVLAHRISKINDTFRFFTHNTWNFIRSWEYQDFDFNKYHTRINPSGTQKYLLSKPIDRMSVAGMKEQLNSDIVYTLGRNNYNHPLVCTSYYLLRKVLRRCFSEITVNLESFYTEVDRNEKNIIICPTHRSFFDFILISYIFYEKSTLGIELPRIAATSDLKKIPILGELLEILGCFYVTRGGGKKDEKLNQKIHKLINDGCNIEFFIEGKRSRSRQYLPYKTGLIRCLQETGKEFKVLPIVISYEKIPEQNVLENEILTGAKYPLNITDLILWTYKLLSRGMNLGRVNISAGKSFKLRPDDDPRKFLPRVMREFQLHTVSTTYHHNYIHDPSRQTFVTGLTDIRPLTLLEEWIGKNHWIHRHLSVKNTKNIWKQEYIVRYNYLHEEDKSFTPESDKVVNEFFSPLLSDIRIILETLEEYRIIPHDILGDLALGTISLDFVRDYLINNKYLDSDGLLIKNLKGILDSVNLD